MGTNILTIIAITIITLGVGFGIVSIIVPPNINRDLYNAIVFSQNLSITIGITIMLYQKKNQVIKLWKYIKSNSIYPPNSPLYLKLLIVYIIVLTFGIYFGNRNGFEGDDIVQIDGIVNTIEYGSEAYRYHMHPLSFELNRFIYYIFNDIELLYISPAIFGSIGICFLVGTIHLYSQKQLKVSSSLALLLILPELFMTILYYNSTAFAMAFFGMSLFLIYWHNDKPKKYLIIPLASGVVFALSCLFRIDFCITLPMIIYIYLQQGKKYKELILFLLGGLIILIISLVSNIFVPEKLIDIIMFYSKEDIDKLSGITLENIIINFFSITPLLIWIVLYLYSIFFVVKNIKLKQWKNLLVLIPITFLLYPIKLLASPKYLVPLLFFMPLLFVKILNDVEQKNKYPNLLKYSLLTFILFMQFYSIEIRYSSLPYLSITKKPQKIHTHDGIRYTGAYLYRYYEVRETRKNPFPGIGEQIFKAIDKSPASFIIVFPHYPNLLYWPAYSRSFALYLQKKNYNRVKNKKGDIILSNNNKTITITYYKPQSYNKEIILVLPKGKQDDPKVKQKIKNFIANSHRLINQYKNNITQY